MITGVGGDIAPETQAGRLFSAIYMPFGITIVLSAFAELVVLWEMQKLCKENRLRSILLMLADESDEDGSWAATTRR